MCLSVKYWTCYKVAHCSMEINWRKKSKKPCVSEKNRITCLKFAPEHAGVSSSGNVTCGVMSPRLAVTTNHSSMYGEQNKKQAYVVPCKEPWSIRSQSMYGGVYVEWCWRSASAKGYFDCTRNQNIGKFWFIILVPAANRLNPEGFILQKDNDPKHTRNVVRKIPSK